MAVRAHRRMCNDCLTKGLWSHDENAQLDKFINGFGPRKKRPSYRTVKKAEPEEAAEATSPPQAAAVAEAIVVTAQPAANPLPAAEASQPE